MNPYSLYMSKLNTVDEVETYILSSNDKDLINIWENLQESFDNDVDRITTFNRIAAKRA